MAMTRYILIGIDILLNILIGGQIGMTISSHCFLAAKRGKLWAIILLQTLNQIENDHCQLALQNDIDRAKAILVTLEPHDERLFGSDLSDIG